MATLTGGLVGGLVATIMMTVFMMALSDDSPSPTALLYAKILGGDPADAEMQGMVLHLLYGVIAGGVFALAVTWLGIGVGSLVSAVAWGIVYGLVLFVVGAAFWMNAVLGIEPDRKMAMGFGFFHLVYGVVLGAWLAVGPL